MRDEGLAALVVAGRGVISQYGYLEYVTGYCPVVRAAYAVVLSDGEPVLVVPTSADAWHARRVAAIADVRVAGEGDVLGGYDDLPSAVAAVIGGAGAGERPVGVVGMRHIVPVGDHEALRRTLPNARLVDATALLAAIKAIKDEEEIEELRLTAATADAGLETCLRLLRPGSDGWTVGAAMEETVRARGAREALVFLSADPYFLARPDSREFRPGDLVTAYVEITGPTGYWLELARLIALGPLDDERERLAAAALAAAQAAAARLPAGNRAGEVAAAIDEHAARLALRSGIWHGHGVGVDHDVPVITASDDTLLAERMVVSIHPNFSAADESIGASVADTYVVRGQEPERLSRLPQELCRL